ncbi:MAG: DUF1800 domain-containing protein [Planctomycetota bacterium]
MAQRPLLALALLLAVLFCLPTNVFAQATLGDDEDEQRRIRELGLGAAGTGSGSSSTRKSIRAEEDAGPALTERERATHALNRMAFGARPGQVDRIMKMGIENWMRQQLDPDSIDDVYVEEVITEKAPSLGMTSGEIFRKYRPAYTPYSSKPPSKAERELRRKEQNERNRMEAQVERQLRDSVYHRAVYSERQFQEVIVAFWREHFSIDQQKGEVGLLANNWEEEVIRKHAFGKFEDLLMASARHPAMLIYLDNIVSQKPLTEREQKLVDRFENRDNVPRSVRALGRQRGLNENYARELMELHTLGVDREYKQRDVTELSRVLTGWTAKWTGNDDRQEGDYLFYFNPSVHDTNNKVVLGSRLRGGGEDQGRTVIRALAKHKYTADFIARKLCAYLLRDKPSEDLVKEVAKVYTRTKGDLPKVYEAIVFSEDFFYRQNRSVKFKTPFEFAISSLRATGAEIDDYQQVDRALELMGQATYRCPDPTGWYDSKEAWLDPGVLVYRWTFAMDLAGNRISGVRVPDALLANLPAKELKEKMQKQVLPGGLNDRTSLIIDEELGRRPTAEQMLATMLGSPDFQQQ